MSFRIAEALHGDDLPMPRRHLLQYTRPRHGVPKHEFSTDFKWSRLRDRFVLVGTSSDSDRVSTPYGDLQGIEVLAFTANSLRTGTHIRRLDNRWVFPTLFVTCYLLTLVYARGFPGRVILATAVGIAGTLILLATLIMYFARVWVDISYPLLGETTLTILLLWIRAQRGAHATTPGASAELAPRVFDDLGTERRPGSPRLLSGAEAESRLEREQEEPEFDVFLSHNSRDKPAVKELGRALIARGLEPWLDEWELAPGSDWQGDLEELIRTVGSSAVIVGPHGLGPWEIPEIRASLSESVRRGLPVIPVLLPGAPTKPVLPLFLTQFTWVDLRNGLSEEGLARLEWGITGKKP